MQRVMMDPEKVRKIERWGFSNKGVTKMNVVQAPDKGSL